MEPVRVDLARTGTSGGMTGEDRSLVLWALSSLMVAEERITTKFSGLVGAYGTEEEATFLATQQVDEARHMQFYARFQDEVIADPADDRRPRRASPRALAPFSEIFDEALVHAHERLVAEPADAGAKVEFVTTYHMVIEGTLGLTAFNFITRYLRARACCPASSRVLEDPPRRAAPHRLRHLVPARGGARDARAGRKRPRDAAGAPARRRRRRWRHRTATTPTGRRSAPSSERSATSRSRACRDGSTSSACRSIRCRWPTSYSSASTTPGARRLPGALRARGRGPPRGFVGRHDACGRVHPEVVEVMRELDIDLSDQKPKELTREMAERADVVVTMGCGDAARTSPASATSTGTYPIRPGFRSSRCGRSATTSLRASTRWSGYWGILADVRPSDR